MRIFPWLWTTESLPETQEALLRSLKEGKFPEKLWFLVLSDDASHLADILKGSELTKPYYTESDRMIIGAAEKAEKAEELMASILSMLYKRDPGLDLRAYIEEVIKEENDA